MVGTHPKPSCGACVLSSTMDADDFFSVEPGVDPVVQSEPHVSKKARKADRVAADIKANLSALSTETLVQIMLNSVSHGTGGGGGSVSWLRQRAADAVALLPVEQRPGYTRTSLDMSPCPCQHTPSRAPNVHAHITPIAHSLARDQA